MHGLEQQWGDRINFVYLDIDDARNDDFKRQFGYRYQPHIFLLDGQGQIVDQWIGRVSGETLLAALEAVTP